jgi:hypothetical protein
MVSRQWWWKRARQLAQVAVTSCVQGGGQAVVTSCVQEEAT